MSKGDQLAQCDCLAFAQFRLFPKERLLLCGDSLVEVGARSFDLLTALAERGGATLTKWQLMDIVWPGLAVEEVTLRVHITALRRALRDGKDGARFIVNVPGRGYSFVAPLERLSAGARLDAPSPAIVAPTSDLPDLPQSLIGRQQTIATLSALLGARRFLSIVGPGGIGKTTVALAVAHVWRAEFDKDLVCFVDLSAIVEPEALLRQIATAVGFAMTAAVSEAALLTFLSGRRMLLALDCCEHALKFIAPFTEALFRAVPTAFILTTSREALRVQGESVHLLSPLAGPSGEQPTAAQALATPAVQLFMDRAAASGYAQELTDGDAAVVASICRRLDGLPLAIELAASRVGAFGVAGIADLLDKGAILALQGRRSARPRHQTLGAALEWSFALLTENEQDLFRQLSVFVGPFTLEAAMAVAPLGQAQPQLAYNVFFNLIDKSLIAIEPSSGVARFRLLDATQAFAAGKLAESDDADRMAAHHARHVIDALREISMLTALTASEVEIFARQMGNIRKALEWCFSSRGDVKLGVALAIRAIAIFIDLSLNAECCRWCRQALAALADEARGGPAELDLLEALAHSSMLTNGVGGETEAALERGLAIASQAQDSARQIRFLVGLNVFRSRRGDFKAALAAAQRCEAIAASGADRRARALAAWTLGVAHQIAGDQRQGFEHCRRGFAVADDDDIGVIKLFGFDHRVRARIGLARGLWLQGYPDQARQIADRIAADEASNPSPVSYCNNIFFTVPVHLWRGEPQEAMKLIDPALAKAAKYSLAFYHALGQALKGEALAALGQPDAGAALLREAIAVMQEQRYHLVLPPSFRALSEALLRGGNVAESLRAIDLGLAQVEKSDDVLWRPELLRMRAEILFAQTPHDRNQRLDLLTAAMAGARQQGALGWELKAALSMARLLDGADRKDEARERITAILDRFSEGFQTRDLILAQAVAAGNFDGLRRS